MVPKGQVVTRTKRTLTTEDFLRIARQENERLQDEWDKALRIQRILGNAVLAIALGAEPANVIAAAAYRECWPESKDLPAPPTKKRTKR